MSCGCGKKYESKYDTARRMALTESKADKSDYVIYYLNNSVHYDKKTCWEKDGEKGELKEIIYFI